MRNIKSLLFLLGLFLLLQVNVYASTNTYTRTEDNLLVPDYITVTDENKSIILNTPAVNADEKIYDFADLYSDSEEKELYYKVMSYSDNYSLDLVIVTINKNNKGTAKEYAQDFYDYNAFGIGDDHSGVLFIIDMDTREIYMTTTGKAIETYADSDIEIALDKVYTYMSYEKYYEGTVKYIDTISFTGSSIYDDNIINKSKLEKFVEILPTSLLISLVVTIIVMIILVGKNRLVRKAVLATDSVVQDKKEIKLVSDKFLGVHVSKVPINTGSGGSGGRGGSSISHGSSGISHGGGGHKF